MDRDQSEVNIRDLGLAAALWSCGHELLHAGIDLEDKMFFEFSPSLELQRCIKSYKADTLYVKARSYSDNAKTLKSKAHADRWGL